MKEGRERKHTSGKQRRDALEESTRVARAITDEERHQRDAKTERLKQARLDAQKRRKTKDDV